MVSEFPIRPFTESAAARIWRVTPPEARHILQSLASRGILLDVELEGESVYALAPPMAGFFEFSLMRFRSDIDQQALYQLFFQYLSQRPPAKPGAWSLYSSLRYAA